MSVQILSVAMSRSGHHAVLEYLQAASREPMQIILEAWDLNFGDPPARPQPSFILDTEEMPISLSLALAAGYDPWRTSAGRKVLVVITRRSDQLFASRIRKASHKDTLFPDLPFDAPTPHSPGWTGLGAAALYRDHTNGPRPFPVPGLDNAYPVKFDLFIANAAYRSQVLRQVFGPQKYSMGDAEGQLSKLSWGKSAFGSTPATPLADRKDELTDAEVAQLNRQVMMTDFAEALPEPVGPRVRADVPDWYVAARHGRPIIAARPTNPVIVQGAILRRASNPKQQHTVLCPQDAAGAPIDPELVYNLPTVERWCDRALHDLENVPV